MDPWKYWDITHRDLDIMNPLSSKKLDQVVEAMALPAGSRVLDVACGKGELLRRAARRWGARGVGVDLSPYCVAEARARNRLEGLGNPISVEEGEGRAFSRGQQARFDAACCLGATWVFGGFGGTLEALKRVTVEGGVVAVGHLYWRRRPSPCFRKLAEKQEGSIVSHLANLEQVRREGLELLRVYPSSLNELDQYERSQWRAAARFVRAHPEDPDCVDVQRRIDESKAAHLSEGAACFGWAVYLARKGRPSLR